MAIYLNEDDIKALNRYIDRLLERFHSGEVDLYTTRADLEHIITSAASDHPELVQFLRTTPDQVFRNSGIDITVRG